MTKQRLFEILDGNNETRAAVWYGRIMVLLIILSLLPLCFHDENYALVAIEYVCVAVFIADYIARWATADLKLKKGAVSFLVYPFTPMALIDLLSILPTFIAINPAWRTLRTLRLLRALRVFKLVRYSKSVTALVNALKKQGKSLLIVLLFAVAYVLVCALIIFNVEPETFPSFFEAVYWSVVSLTTVGYGDLFPHSEMGRFIAMVSSFMGIAIVAMPAGIITAGLIEELKKGDE